MDYLSSASLKRMARGQLFGRLGTVIGAFLLLLVTLLPFLFLFFMSIVLVETLAMTGKSILPGFLFELLSLFLTFLFLSVMLYGQNNLYLKIVTGRETAAADLFLGFREKFLRIVGAGMLPSAILLLFALPFINALNRMLTELYTDEEFMSAVYDSVLSGQGGLVAALPQETMNALYERIEPYNRMMTRGMIIFGAGLLLTGILFSQILFLALDYVELSVSGILRENFRIFRDHGSRIVLTVLSFTPWFLLSLLYCTCLTVIWVFPYYKATMANFYIDLMRTGDHNGT